MNRALIVVAVGATRGAVAAEHRGHAVSVEVAVAHRAGVAIFVATTGVTHLDEPGVAFGVSVVAVVSAAANRLVAVGVRVPLHFADRAAECVGFIATLGRHAGAAEGDAPARIGTLASGQAALLTGAEEAVIALGVGLAQGRAAIGLLHHRVVPTREDEETKSERHPSRRELHAPTLARGSLDSQPDRRLVTRGYRAPSRRSRLT